MQAILYNKSDGKIVVRKTIPSLEYLTDVTDDVLYVISNDSESTHYINGEFQNIPDRETLVHYIRLERNELLNKIDIVHCNAEKWAAMTEEQKQYWIEYKQSLRDFPETCNIENPVWPTPPK